MVQLIVGDVPFHTAVRLHTSMHSRFALRPPFYTTIKYTADIGDGLYEMVVVGV